LQHSADSLQGQGHADIEVFQLAGGKVGGVGVVQRGKRIHIKLVYILAVHILDTLDLVFVAFHQQRFGVIGFLVGNQQAYIAVLYALAPQIVQFLVGTQPLLCIRINDHGLIGGQVKGFWFFQQGNVLLKALEHSLLVILENNECRGKITLLHQIIKTRIPLAVVFVDMGLQQIDARRVEGVEIVGEEIPRQRVVHRNGAVVLGAQFFEQLKGRFDLLVGKGQGFRSSPHASAGQANQQEARQ